MDYDQAEKQITQIQQQSQDVGNRMRTFAQKLAGSVTDKDTARDLAMDLREIALTIQQQQQQTAFVLQQMGQHIQQLENAVTQHPPAAQYAQPRGWGAGIGVGEDLANDLFNMF